MIDAIEHLLERQARVWPQLAIGIEALALASTRSMRVDWYEVYIRHIPHRIVSTTAEVDRVSIAKRQCFLCAENLPLAEEGLPFGQDFMIYCNPFPIVDRHLTIAHRAHSPQRISNQLGNMLDLAAALPGYFVIYNGPECGASAPDHMHFQAGSRALFPIEKDTAGRTGITVPNYGRNVFMFRERDKAASIARMDRVIELLAQTTGKRAEPMVNFAVFYDNGEWVTYLFPRGKHRPEVFHTGELTISPAAIDLCGIVAVPLAKDFEKITGEDVAAVFREVTLPQDQFDEVGERLGSAH
jgi:Domain of unknown function (DUF4922)